MYCDAAMKIVSNPRSISVGIYVEDRRYDLNLVDLMKICIKTILKDNQKYLSCETAFKVAKNRTLIGLPFFYSNFLIIDKEKKRIGIQPKKLNHYSHLLGIMFSKTDTELEYLIYVLFGIDGFLLTIITGYIWNKRFDIVQMGINNFLNA